MAVQVYIQSPNSKQQLPSVYFDNIHTLVPPAVLLAMAAASITGVQSIKCIYRMSK
jgi:hypothetical protein